MFEWYDFIVFGLLTVVVSRLFFPTDSQYASLLLTTATFGFGFCMRPVGGILLGIYADRLGVMIFGGFAQFFVTWLIHATGSPIAPVYYMMFRAAITLVSLLFIFDPAREPRGQLAVSAPEPVV